MSQAAAATAGVSNMAKENLKDSDEAAKACMTCRRVVRIAHPPSIAVHLHTITQWVS